MILRYILLWLPMIMLAFANATIRELILKKYFTDTTSHQLSTNTLIIFCFAYTWFVYPWLRIQETKQAFLIGIIWVVLTMAFEFSLGLSTGKTWRSMLQDYNILAGHIWALFLIALFFLPLICHKLKINP